MPMSSPPTQAPRPDARRSPNRHGVRTRRRPALVNAEMKQEPAARIVNVKERGYVISASECRVSRHGGFERIGLRHHDDNESYHISKQ